jgi:hypothetical protein
VPIYAMALVLIETDGVVAEKVKMVESIADESELVRVYVTV